MQKIDQRIVKSPSDPLVIALCESSPLARPATMSAAAATASYPVYNTPEVNSGTTTSWIPLTTAWPSQSGCASSFFLYPGQPQAVAWDPGYGYFAGGTPDCLPPEATTWHEQNHQNGDGFTSLSIRPIVCPAAFTTAASSVQSGSSTLVLCCPSYVIPAFRFTSQHLLNIMVGDMISKAANQAER